jgi:hypothetical protein
MSIKEEDIEILIEQTNIDRDNAKKLLIKHNGDIVECILETHNEEFISDEIKNIEKIENDDIEKDVDTSKKENLIDYRDIVDEKDTIYNKRSNKKFDKLENEKKGIKEEIKKYDLESLYYSTKKSGINIVKVL